MAIDLSTVPLVATGVINRQVIATMLNPTKVLPSDNGLPRYVFVHDFNGYLIRTSKVVTNL